MHQGKIWEAGASAEIFGAPKTPELQGFLSAGAH
jgi:polar amino acid transport system ATP-binding protein